MNAKAVKEPEAEVAEPSLAQLLEMRRVKRKERRAKYLERLTPKQRRIRDDYVHWLRWWKHEYAKLSKTIHSQKKFVRTQAHNNLETLKQSMRGLELHRLRARTMLLARMAAVVEHTLKMEEEDNVAAMDAIPGQGK